MRRLLLLAALTVPAAAQWTIQTPATTADLRGIDNVGKGIAWASGTGGTVLRTEDNGYLWQRCITPPGAEHLDFRGIQAFDANTAIVMSSGKGDLSRLYKTTDGCQTWTLVLTNPDKDGFWDAIQFDSPKFGKLLGDPVGGEFVLFETGDRGDTWTRLIPHKHDRIHGCSLGKFAALPGESVFAASNESFAFGEPLSISYFFVTGGPRSRFVYLHGSSDVDGLLCSASAKSIKLPLGGSASSGAFAAAARTVNGSTVKTMEGHPILHVMVVGGDYTQPDATAGTAAYVSPSPPYDLPPFGTVRKPATPPHGYRSAVAYDAPTKTWITVGPNGTDISTDDGRNWHALKPSPTEAPDADRNWNALSLPFVVGPHGRIGILNPTALKPPTKP
jgi:hypothetical protein